MNNLILKDKFKRTISSDPFELEHTKAKNIFLIPIDKLIVDEKNSTLYIVNDEYKESIKRDGLKSPFKVKKLNDDKYLVIGGNKRLCAFQEILKENNDFKYWFNNSNEMLDPHKDGIPCLILPKNMSDLEIDKARLLDNKTRNLDKLEKYNLALEVKSMYEKEHDIDKTFQGRCVDYAVLYVPLSLGTLKKIYADTWDIINSSNVNEIRAAGSYENYCKMLTDKQKENKRICDEKDKKTDYSLNDKQKKKLNNIERYFDKMLISKSSNLQATDEIEVKGLRSQAINSICKIMEYYDLSVEDLNTK